MEYGELWLSDLLTKICLFSIEKSVEYFFAVKMVPVWPGNENTDNINVSAFVI